MKMERKTGLVLEGGGMRGVFTSGVLDAFMKHDLYFPYTVAVSAGACNGMSYISRQPRRARISNIDYLARYEYIGLRHLVTQGCIFDRRLLYDKFPNQLLPFDFDTYFQHAEGFEMVTTNCLTGHAMYLSETHDKQRALDIVRASSCLPYVSKIVNVDGIPMLDGGIADSIPLKQYFENGYEKAVVVLTRPKNYRKNGDIHGAGLFYKKYPEFSETLKNRNRAYNEQCEYVENLENEGRILVIRPSETVAVSRTEKDPAVLQKMYNLGVKDCMGKIAEIKDYLIK